MDYKEFTKLTSQVEYTCFVIDNPSNRMNYMFCNKWDMLDKLPSDTEFTIVAENKFPEVIGIMMDNYESEMRPADGVEDEGYDEMMNAFHTGKMHLGIWDDGKNTIYMLVYDYDPDADERTRIGERVAELRRERNMTQRELATKAGLYRTHINAIEAGRYNLRVDTLGQIARALDATVDLVPNHRPRPRAQQD